MKKFAAAFMIAGAALSAHAQFLSSDSSLGTDSLVTDTLTGKVWLNLDLTVGQSFDDVMLRVATDPLYAGFRYAGSSDLLQLFTDGGFCVGDVTCSPPSATDLAATASFAAAFDGTPGPVSGTEQFIGYIGDFRYPIGTGLFGLFRTFATYDPTNTSYTRAALDATGPASWQATPGTSTWLVRDAPVAAVPEPSTYALLLAGLTAVAFSVRRRRIDQPL